MFSQRFQKTVIITAHAQRRMADRQIDAGLLLDIIETGELRSKTAQQIWIAKHLTDRNDNLLCIAAVIEEALVVKTVMHHFTWELPS